MNSRMYVESRRFVFSDCEKNIFNEILRKFRNVVDSKQIDNTAMRIKNIAWDQITKEYNAHPHITTPASVKQLKRLFSNLKQRQKEALKTRQHHHPRKSPNNDIDSENITPSPIVLLQTLNGHDIADSEQGDTKENLTGLSDPLNNLTDPDILRLTDPILPQSPEFPNEPPSEPLVNHSEPRGESRRVAKVLELEYKDRKKRADDLHELQKQLLLEQIREARAKADLAELLLRQKDTN